MEGEANDLQKQGVTNKTHEQGVGTEKGTRGADRDRHKGVMFELYFHNGVLVAIITTVELILSLDWAKIEPKNCFLLVLSYVMVAENV